jgi:hypothetical protein
MRISGVDHTGPVLVINSGVREERWSMDQVQAAAGAPTWLREWLNKATREE